MKKIFVLLVFIVSSLASAETVKVSEGDSVLLFRYVGAVLRSTQDTKNEYIHTDLMMCTIYFSGSPTAPKLARCLLPNEQAIVDKENGFDVSMLLKKYGMPANHQTGYLTFQAGLDCVNALSGDEYPKCTLTAVP